MVDGVGQSGVSRARLERLAYERATRIAKTGDSPARDQANATSSLAADLAAATSVPVDAAKVAAIRTAIAQGRYPVNPQKIAERMIALDMPRRDYA